MVALLLHTTRVRSHLLEGWQCGGFTNKQINKQRTQIVARQKKSVANPPTGGVEIQLLLGATKRAFSTS